jgi:hypothetical protein
MGNVPSFEMAVTATAADTDLDALVVPSTVKLAGGIFATTGVFTCIIGLQIWGLLTVTGLLQLVAPLALILGIGDVVLGAGVARARLRSVSLGLGFAIVTALFALAWSVFALLNGVLSLISFAVLPFAGVSALLIITSRARVRVIDEARQRLRTQGLDAGL